MLTVIVIVAIIVVLYLLAIMPRVVNRPDDTPLKGVFYAHRGLHDNQSDAPENSLKAFQKAVDAGYGIELDVQLTKDEIAVVFHDETLERICKTSGNVRDFTYKELTQFMLLDTKETIPTFAEVLKVVGGKVPLIVEIKMHTGSTMICKKVNELLVNYQGAYCIESFHPLAVMWYRKNRPDIVRGQLSSDFRKETGMETIAHFIVHHLLTNCLTKPDFIAYCHLYKRAVSRTICQKWYQALSVTWTIRSQEELDAASESFDLFIFEQFIPRESEFQ